MAAACFFTTTFFHISLRSNDKQFTFFIKSSDTFVTCFFNETLHSTQNTYILSCDCRTETQYCIYANHHRFSNHVNNHFNKFSLHGPVFGLSLLNPFIHSLHRLLIDTIKKSFRFVFESNCTNTYTTRVFVCVFDACQPITSKYFCIGSLRLP